MTLVASGVAPPAPAAPTINAQLVPPANANNSLVAPIQQRPQDTLTMLGAGSPYRNSLYDGK